MSRRRPWNDDDDDDRYYNSDGRGSTLLVGVVIGVIILVGYGIKELIQWLQS
jgi:hypothetical protein